MIGNPTSRMIRTVLPNGMISETVPDRQFRAMEANGSWVTITSPGCRVATTSPQRTDAAKNSCPLGVIPPTRTCPGWENRGSPSVLTTLCGGTLT